MVSIFGKKRVTSGTRSWLWVAGLSLLLGGLPTAAWTNWDGKKSIAGWNKSHARHGSFVLHPRMMKALDLTEEQKGKFQEYRTAQREKKISLRAEKTKLELELKRILSAYPINAAEVKRVGAQLADIEGRKVELTLESLTFFLENLSQEQHAKMVKLHEERQEKRKNGKERGKAKPVEK